MENFIVVDTVAAGEDGYLRVHGLVFFFGFFDFFRDFGVVFAAEDAFYNNGEADDDEEDGEDGFPGDFVGKDFLGGEQQNDAGGEKAEAR